MLSIVKKQGLLHFFRAAESSFSGRKRVLPSYWLFPLVALIFLNYLKVARTVDITVGAEVENFCSSSKADSMQD